MSRKVRVAVGVTGQLRSYNELEFTLSETIHQLFPEETYEVDLYGVVWNDDPQRRPKDEDKFKQLFYINPNDVWDQLKANVFDLLPWQTSWLENEEYTEALDNKFEFHKLAKDRIINTYAQTYAHHYCAKQIQQSDDFYDIVLRFRWDCYLSATDDYTDINNPTARSYAQFHAENLKMLKHESQFGKKSVQNGIVRFMGPGYEIMERDDYITYHADDMAIVFDRAANQRLASTPYVELVKKAHKIQPVREIFENKMHSHELWLKIIQATGALITHAPELDSIVVGSTLGYHGDNYVQWNKVNKKWDN